MEKIIYGVVIWSEKFSSRCLLVMTMIDFSTTQTVRVSLKFVLSVGQYLGYFPVFYTRFVWKSWKVLFNLVVLSCTMVFHIITITWIIKQIRTPVSYQKIESLALSVFYAYSAFLQFHFATKWPKIMKEWWQIDKAMNKVYGHPKHLKSLITIMATLFLLLNIGKY